ncbi:hypothetical protein BD560DRAFT_395629 [Blakeslea trispora]|nr:hypothetical protein BD560DRAFT_395629 [Blakeslea trispora]
MNHSSFDLWSPPILDLSLDTFSDDLIHEFDKKRNSLIHSVTESTEAITIPSCTSSSASTLPKDNEDEGSTLEYSQDSVTSSIERKSFGVSDEVIGMAKPYPPRPLQYSPIMAPIRLSSETESTSHSGSSTTHVADTDDTILCSRTLMQADASIQNLSILKEQKTNRKSNSHSLPAIVDRGHTLSPTPGVSMKRRSFFSLRFC